MSWRMTFANLRSELWSFAARFAALRFNEPSSNEALCFLDGGDIKDHRGRPDCQYEPDY